MFTGVVVDGYEMAKDQESVQVETDTVGIDRFRVLKLAILRAPWTGTIVRAHSERWSSTRRWRGAGPIAIQWERGSIRLGNRKGEEAVVAGSVKDAVYRSTYESRIPICIFPSSRISKVA